LFAEKRVDDTRTANLGLHQNHSRMFVNGLADYAGLMS
jgi:hypothetical protein